MRDPGLEIDSGIKMPVLPLFQRPSAHAILVMHIHKSLLVRLPIETVVVVSVWGGS